MRATEQGCGHKTVHLAINMNRLADYVPMAQVFGLEVPLKFSLQSLTQKEIGDSYMYM